MLRITQRTVVRAIVLCLGMSFWACSDKEKEPETPTEQSAETLPAEPPMDDLSSAENTSFSAETVYFAYDRSDLSSQTQSALNALAEHLKSNSSSLQIEGHCDSRGTTEYNLALGARRAESVKDFLVQLGIEGSRITTISFGEEKPKNEAETEEAYAQNRRAEFTVSGS